MLPMCKADAPQIADGWAYEGEYAFYNMTADPEDYAAFTDAEPRARSIFRHGRAAHWQGISALGRKGRRPSLAWGYAQTCAAMGLGGRF